MADDREYPIEWDPTEYRYIQIADHIEQQIRDGVLAEGAALLSIPALGEEYGVARMTIKRAVEVLVERGLVVVLRGRGTFVRRQS
ncbi:winged helix-turn-helix domain-containing protein [Actinomadura sp. 7K507]|uniref:GntR family transcriptional regulator n=1 Tax=Actinomadura sp. 7K507 TaxID=2530365 RepID=UPI00104F3795|nr:winged helix-turn-helix domain-containing protein [Actinomadura sp. 7K507]TDC96028.1 GntR family transcriptional regulator [Actinomadura sp. 7K507]